jgi:hypothetical protein
VIALVRAIGGGSPNHQDKHQLRVVYRSLLLHVEASVAVIMGAVMALRTVFVPQTHGQNQNTASEGKVGLYYRIKA